MTGLEPCPGEDSYGLEKTRNEQRLTEGGYTWLVLFQERCGIDAGIFGEAPRMGKRIPTWRLLASTRLRKKRAGRKLGEIWSAGQPTAAAAKIVFSR